MPCVGLKFIILLSLVTICFSFTSFLHKIHTLKCSDGKFRCGDRNFPLQAISTDSPLNKLQSIAITKSNAEKVYDLYGRIPNDDWLFTTKNLINPNLFKSTYAESILREIPIVLRKTSREIVFPAAVGALLQALLIVFIFAFVANQLSTNFFAPEFDTPIKAIRKDES